MATTTSSITNAVSVPVFSEPAYQFSVLETEANGAFVGSIVVTNAASSAYDLTISPAALFSLSGDGKIRVAHALDYETRTTYNLTVTATGVEGSGIGSALAIVVITVRDANEYAPVMAASWYLAAVREDASVNTEIPVMLDSGNNADISATDADTGSAGQVVFSLLSANGLIGMHPSGGLFVLGPLDRETMPVMLLECRARSDGEPYARDTFFTVVVVVGDVNDNAPVLATTEPATTIEVFPDTRVGSVVARLTGTDKDSGPLLSYTMIEPSTASSNGIMPVRLLSASGELEWLGGVAEGSEFSFKYVIADSAFSVTSAPVTVRVVRDPRCDTVICASPDACHRDGACVVDSDGAASCQKGAFVGASVTCQPCECGAEISALGLSWDATPCGSFSVQPCNSLNVSDLFFEFQGSVRRTCLSTGVWATEDLGGCANRYLAELATSANPSAATDLPATLAGILSEAPVITSFDMAHIKVLVGALVDGLADETELELAEPKLTSLVDLVSQIMDLPNSLIESAPNSARAAGAGSFTADFILSPWPLAHGLPTDSEKAVVQAVLGHLLPNLINPELSLLQQVSGTLRIRVSGNAMLNHVDGLEAAARSLASTGLFIDTVAPLLPRTAGLVLAFRSFLFHEQTLLSLLESALAKALAVTPAGTSHGYQAPNLLVEATRLDCAQLPGSAWLRGLVSVPSVPNCNGSAAMYLVSYLKPSLFASGSLLSGVVAMSYGTPTSASEPVIVFSLPLLAAPTAAGIPECSYWDVAAQSWESDGCVLVSASSTSVTCSCTHLTNFAVVSSGSSADSQSAASGLTDRVFWLLIFAVPVLLLVCVHFVAAGVLRTYGRFLLANFALALASALLLFVLGMDASDAGTCKAVALCVHFALLSACTWLLMHTVHVARRLRALVAGNAAPKELRVSASLIAIGLPLGFVILCAIGLWEEYAAGTGNQCWLSSERLLWALVSPGACFALAELVLCVWMHRRLPAARPGDVDSIRRRDRVARTLTATMLFAPLFFVTWIFGVLSVAFSGHSGLQYAFAASAIMGSLLFFVAFYALDPRVRAYWAGARTAVNPASDTSSSRYDATPAAGAGGKAAWPEKEKSTADRLGAVMMFGLHENLHSWWLDSQDHPDMRKSETADSRAPPTHFYPESAVPSTYTTTVSLPRDARRSLFGPGSSPERDRKASAAVEPTTISVDAERMRYEERLKQLATKKSRRISRPTSAVTDPPVMDEAELLADHDQESWDPAKVMADLLAVRRTAAAASKAAPANHNGF